MFGATSHISAHVQSAFTVTARSFVVLVVRIENDPWPAAEDSHANEPICRWRLLSIDGIFQFADQSVTILGP